MKNMLRMLLLFGLIAIFAISFMGCNGKSTGKKVLFFEGGKGILTFNVQLGNEIGGGVDSSKDYNAKGQFEYKNDIQCSGKVLLCGIDMVNGNGYFIGITSDNLLFTATVYDDNDSGSVNQGDRIEIEVVEKGYLYCGAISGGGI